MNERDTAAVRVAQTRLGVVGLYFGGQLLQFQLTDDLLRGKIVTIWDRSRSKKKYVFF